MPYLLFTLIISIIVAVFAVQNAADVTVGFLMWTVQTSLVVVILGAALLGALAMGFFTLMLKAKHYLYNKSLKFEIDQLKKENAKLKEEKEMLMHSQRNKELEKPAEEAVSKALTNLTGKKRKNWRSRRAFRRWWQAFC